MKKLAVLVMLLSCSLASYAGGAITGKVRAVNTDSRDNHTSNHGIVFVMLAGSTERYYLDSNGPSGDVNMSMLLMAFASGQDVYIQWNEAPLASGFSKKITLLAIGDDWPWPAN